MKDISGKKNENKNEDNFLKHKKEKGNNVICEYSDKFRFDDEQEKELIVVNGILIQICCMKLKTQGSEI